jgi:hypothetical protein
MRIGRGKQRTWRKQGPVSLCPQQIAYNLIWEQTQATAMENRWVMNELLLWHSQHVKMPSKIWTHSTDRLLLLLVYSPSNGLLCGGGICTSSWFTHWIRLDITHQSQLLTGHNGVTQQKLDRVQCGVHCVQRVTDSGAWYRDVFSV